MGCLILVHTLYRWSWSTTTDNLLLGDMGDLSASHQPGTISP
jgi:hypothetical protein